MDLSREPEQPHLHYISSPNLLRLECCYQQSRNYHTLLCHWTWWSPLQYVCTHGVAIGPVGDPVRLLIISRRRYINGTKEEEKKKRYEIVVIK